MERGDEMRNGNADSAVRILPNDDPTRSPLDPGPASGRRFWYIPLAVALGVVAMFGLATRPGDPAPPTTTAPPARIADVDAALIDLRTSTAAPLGEEWGSGFEWNGQIEDVIRASSSFVAVGSTNQGAQVWLSGLGGTWRPLPRLDRPDGTASSIDHAVFRDNYTVALGTVEGGVGLWTANEVAAWEYHGVVEEMGETSIIDLVSGPEIVAVAYAPSGGPFVWKSANGVDWTEVGELDVSSELTIAGFTADATHYYVFGQHDCLDAPCAPEILRSSNGRDWESVGNGLLPAGVGGFVTDIVATKDGLRAVGWGRSGDDVATYVWESGNGRDWHPIPGAAEHLRTTAVELELTATGLEPSPWAQLTIAGTTIDAAIGSTIETDAGRLEVSAITDTSIVLSGSDGRNDGIAIGEVRQLEARPDPREIAAEGPRIVITGYLSGPFGRTETVWLSIDGGATWAAQQFPEAYGAVGAITAGASIVVHGEVGGAPTVWRSSWDTKAAGYLAEDLIGDYVDALARQDTDGLIGLLPRWDEGSAPPRLAIPTLGDFEPGWWDTTTGDVVVTRVQDTLDYLAATEAEIRLLGCVSVVSLGVLDRITVRCTYTANSRLLSMFGLEDAPGEISAVVRNGRLSELDLDVAPSAALWRVLANYTDVSAHRNESVALAHMAAAEDSLSQVLRPGSTRVVETVLGTMEWTWLESVDLAQSTYITSVTWSDLGFLAISYNERIADPGPYVWQSQDGRNWSELPAPDEAEGIWELQPFAGGVLGQAWFEGSVRLVHFDGESWIEIGLQPPDSSLQQEISRIAVSNDQALVITTWWDELGRVTHSAATLNRDLVVTAIDLPDGLEVFAEGTINVAGSDSGFLVAASGYYGPQENLSVWTTTDGTDWRLLTQTSSLDDAQYIWGLQEHVSQYFVVGETVERRCSPQQEESYCPNVIGLWSSSDGVDWERVRTESGEPLATRAFGSGPLGLIAFGQELMDTAYPRSVFMSRDGEVWTTAGGLTLLDTSAEWWWSSVPVVGDSTVVAAGSTYPGAGGRDSGDPFLIIGRLVDR